MNHEYLAQLGDVSFSEQATLLLLGANCQQIKDGRAFGVQTLSGTGAVRLGADFLSKVCGLSTVYISSPTWANHNLVFKLAGFTSINQYRYWDDKNLKLNFDGLISDLSSAPENSVVILHACAHNPTGIDPSFEQWKAIADLIEERKLFTFFDCAYQGFASGDLENDSKSVRYFVSRGFEMFCAQSFAKNFGLYNERVGNLTVVLKDASMAANTKSQFSILVRGNYSNPPAHGARMVKKILSDPSLYALWQENIKTMANRIRLMRQLLKKKLQELATPGNWDHITDQIGMFSYTGLNEAQVKHLVEKYHIYLPKSGRISIAGLNPNNIDYVAKAFNDVVKNY